MSGGDEILCAVTSMCPLPRLQFSANSVHRKRRFGGTDFGGSTAKEGAESRMQDAAAEGDAVGAVFEAKWSRCSVSGVTSTML